MKGKRILAAIFFLLAALLTTPAAYGEAAAAPQAFSDVDPGGTNTPYIIFLSQKGIMKGYLDGTFKPENGLTRAEAVTALSIAAKIAPSAAGPSSFSDVPQDHWAAGFISAGVKSNILSGYSDGTFRPENMVTRAELAALLAKLSGLEASASPAAGVPPDHWAAGVIGAAINNGFFLQAGGESFNPDGPASREVFARGAALAVTKNPGLSAVEITGQATPVKGQVWLTAGGRETLLEAATAVSAGTAIRTGGDGEAEVSFEDGTGLLVKPNTSLTITGIKGRLAVGAGGRPVNTTGRLEIKLDQGMVVGACPPGKETPTQTTAAIFSAGLLASAAPLPPPVLAGAAAGSTAGGGKVKVSMPWGTASVSGFWISEVSSSGQSTSVLYGKAVVEANGKAVEVGSGQASAIGSAAAAPGVPGQIGSSEAAKWAGVKQWIDQQAGKIQNSGPLEGGQQAAGGLTSAVSQALAAATGKTPEKTEEENEEMTGQPGGKGGGPSSGDKTPSLSYSMGYSLRDVTPDDNSPDINGYQVNIYLDSMENATYIEYTFEFDNTRLVSKGGSPDLNGILRVFEGHDNVSLADLSIDSGWIQSGGVTRRTIHSKQFGTSEVFNYSGGPARLINLRFQRINPGSGDATVAIRNIRVGYGDKYESMPDVTLTLPEL